MVPCTTKSLVRIVFEQLILFVTNSYGRCREYLLTTGTGTRRSHVLSNPDYRSVLVVHIMLMPSFHLTLQYLM
jgi:hypothetical protein